MAARLQATMGRSARNRRLGCAVLYFALLGSNPSPLAADADPGLPGAAADWDGLYVGASAGGFGNSSSLKIVPSPEVFGLFGPLTDAELNSLSSTLRSGAGALGGVQAGFTHRVNRFVIGAEADFSLTSMRGQSDFSKTITTDFCAGTPVPLCLPAAFNYDVKSRHEFPWVATARARLGYLISERMLVFATGGLALGGVHAKFATTLAPAGGLLPDDMTARYAGERRRTRVGAALGGGLEYAFTDMISVKAEYLYVHLGSHSSVFEPERELHDVIPLPGKTGVHPGGPVSTGVSVPSVPGASITTRDHSQFHSVRIGINFHF